MTAHSKRIEPTPRIGAAYGCRSDLFDELANVGAGGYC